MLLAGRCESERLRQIIKELQRHRFGRRAETLPEDQILSLQGVEQLTAYSEAAQDVSAPEGRKVRPRKRRGNHTCRRICHGSRGAVHNGVKACPCCQSELHQIREDRSERLERSPSALSESRYLAHQISLLCLRGRVSCRRRPCPVDSRADYRPKQARSSSDVQTCRSPAPLPAGADLSLPGHLARSFDRGRHAASTCVRDMSASSAKLSGEQRCSLMRRPCRCSILA